MPIDVERARAQFPALALEQDGRPVVFLDGPGGTQVPQRVIDAVTRYYLEQNANTGGAFLTSRRSDAVLAEAHAAFADFLNARSADEVKFGPNMTSLTFALSRSIGATIGPGDEVVVTALDHAGNVGPWEAMAAERDLTVRRVEIDTRDCTLDLDSLDAVLGPRTKLVAVGYASNAVGTVNPVAEIVRRAQAVGALTFVDAVHYAPHGPIDVQALHSDFLACSAYKFFGPHLGVLYGRAELLESLPAYKVGPAQDRWETGTQNHEGIAGALAALDYLADLAPADPGASRRARLEAAMTRIQAYERNLGERLLTGLATIPGVRIHGIADPARSAERVPTVSLTVDGLRPRDAAESLARSGIFAWDGDFYASGLVERLGLADSGGFLRLGLVHYNTAGEVDRVLDALTGIARGARPAVARA
jgi:cysteine desulfurase family protein (TIGR01976 family)